MNRQPLPKTGSTPSNLEACKGQDYIKINVKILMANQQELLGTVVIPAKGYKSRLSDLINNNNNQFLALNDVEIYQGNLLITKTPFLCVNKQNIIYLAEDELTDLKNSEFLKVQID